MANPESQFNHWYVAPESNEKIVSDINTTLLLILLTTIVWVVVSEHDKDFDNAKETLWHWPHPAHRRRPGRRTVVVGPTTLSKSHPSLQARMPSKEGGRWGGRGIVICEASTTGRDVGEHSAALSPPFEHFSKTYQARKTHVKENTATLRETPPTSI